MNPSKLVTYFQTRISSKEVGFLLIALGVVMRLVPHLPNMTPLGALAVWGGLRLQPKMSMGVLIATLLISDAFLGFHDTMWFVYGSLLLISFLATQIRRVTILNGAGITVAGSVMFFLITNFGVWYVSRFHAVPMYPANFSGLMASYVSGIPFLKATLLGDTLYTAGFFALEYLALTAFVNKRILKNVVSN